MLASVTSEQLSEWAAFSRIEAWGDRRLELQLALLCYLTANANRDPKYPPIPYEDFLLDGEKGEPPDPEEMAEAARRMTLAMGGTVG